MRCISNPPKKKNGGVHSGSSNILNQDVTFHQLVSRGGISTKKNTSSCTEHRHNSKRTNKGKYKLLRKKGAICPRTARKKVHDQLKVEIEQTP